MVAQERSVRVSCSLYRHMVAYRQKGFEGMNTVEFLTKFKNDMEKMKAQAAGPINGFAGLFGKTMAEGALTIKEKELVAIGIAVAKQCEPCIILHVQKCLDAGATREEILEASGVAVMMSGGPAYTHIPIVMDAIEALAS